MCLLARRLKSITTFAGLHFGSSSIFNSLNFECISLILVLIQTAKSFSSIAACILFWALQSSLLPKNKKKCELAIVIQYSNAAAMLQTTEASTHTLSFTPPSHTFTPSAPRCWRFSPDLLSLPICSSVPLLFIPPSVAIRSQVIPLFICLHVAR